MLGELTNIPTHALVEMMYIILAADFAITATDVAEVEQIQRELQRRGGGNAGAFKQLTNRNVQGLCVSHELFG